MKEKKYKVRVEVVKIYEFEIEASSKFCAEQIARNRSSSPYYKPEENYIKTDIEDVK